MNDQSMQAGQLPEKEVVEDFKRTGVKALDRAVFALGIKKDQAAVHISPVPDKGTKSREAAL